MPEDKEVKSKRSKSLDSSDSFLKTSENESEDSLSSDAEYKKLKEAKLKEKVDLEDLEEFSSSDVTSEQATELDKGKEKSSPLTKLARLRKLKQTKINMQITQKLTAEHVKLIKACPVLTEDKVKKTGAQVK